MKIELFSICDYAQIEPTSSKLSVFGIFDTIHAKEVPAAHGFCAFAIRVRFRPSEEGKKKFAVTFIDPDGKTIMPVGESELDVKTIPINRTSNVQIVGLIQQLRLSRFGEYAFVLSIDGKPEASVPLFLNQN